jgi:hypothetical protein
MKSALAALVSVATLVTSAPGCSGPRAHALAAAIDVNPLRHARFGDSCRYRAIREGTKGESVEETWILQVASASKGLARVDVTILGSPRTPASPSPREPGYSVKLPQADEGFAGDDLLRLFHRPELTSEGILAVLDRDVTSVEGSVRQFPRVILDRTRQARELTLEFRDRTIDHGRYRIVLADDLPVLGICEAELEEEWTVCDADGQLKKERRHDRLELVEAHEATESR